MASTEAAKDAQLSSEQSRRSEGKSDLETKMESIFLKPLILDYIKFNMFVIW
jgi:hypothetical protein